MLTFIDSYLNKITMYKLVLYVLMLLVAIAAILGFAGVLPYGGIAILFSAFAFLIVCYIFNFLFAWVFKAPTNVESVYITSLIFALIVSPLKSWHDMDFWTILLWAPFIGMASKYIVAIGKKHIFNPAAFGVAVTALALGQAASWWVGTAWMAPFVFVLGILVVRKIRRSDLVFGFLIAALATILVYDAIQGFALWPAFKNVLLDTPVMFFAFIMLTEPLTTPPTRKLRVTYGVITGFLFAPFVHLFNIESTPELALLAANIFSYAVSPKEKLLLRLKKRTELTPDTYDFAFEADKKMKFRAGQYIEWTLAHKDPDNRGNRRYFTISSAPSMMASTNDKTSESSMLHMGVKFYEKSSSFKKALKDMKEGSTLVAGQLAGDFTLPKDISRKLVFIAGGIGVTPFTSMVREMLIQGERRDIILFYSNKVSGEIAYKDVFDKAERELGLKVVHTLAGGPPAEASWKGERGFVDGPMIMKHAPDFKERYFYVSGPQAMVSAMEKTLLKIGVHESRIKKDFFPGFV